MTSYIGPEDIQQEYNGSRDPGRIQRLLELSEGTGILRYYCCILFPEQTRDVICPGAYSLLAGSYPLTARLIMAHINIPLPRDVFDASVSTGPLSRTASAEEKDILKLLRLLCRYEYDVPDIHEIDIPFIRSLFLSLPPSVRLDFVSRKPLTPLKISLASLPETAAPETSIPSQIASMHPISLSTPHSARPTRHVWRAIATSPLSPVRRRLRDFYESYPEFYTFDSAHSPDRTGYILDPSSIPMDCRMLRTYVPSAAAASQNVLGVYVDASLRIIHEWNVRIMRHVLDAWLWDIPGLAVGILRSGPVLVSESEFVSCLPGLQARFDEILELAKTIRSEGLFRLLEWVVRIYARRENVLSVKDNALYFNSSFISEIRGLLILL